MTHVISSFDISVYDKDIASTLFFLNIDVTSWTLDKDDSNIPTIVDFEIIGKLNIYDTYGMKKQKLSIVYYSKKLNIIIISFAGTTKLSEWLDDFDARQTSPIAITTDDIYKVHLQHYNMYNSLRESFIDLLKTYVNDDTTIVVTGYSLGASISNICMFDITMNTLCNKRVLYNFASCRTGNNNFVKILDNEHIYRIGNTSDLVPSLPPPVFGKYIYTHTSNGIYFTINTESISSNHCDAYNKYFENFLVVKTKTF